MVVCVATCCHRVSDTEARLIAIDSLVCDQPDSALSLLADINGDSLPTDLQAYHSLLTVQALYKAYIPATSDTLIRRAWDYYRDHGPYNRRIRAMLYMGTVAEELGRPDSAMRWYKRTELESRPDDHYHRGYALEKMAILYQNAFETKQAIDKYRNSIKEFDIIHDTTNVIYCSYQLSRIYQLVTPDSSAFFLEIVDRLAQIKCDTTYIIAAKSCLSAKLFYNDNFECSKNTAVDVINRFADLAPCECWHFASYSYSKLGLKDSALYYFNKAPVPSCAKDSVLYFKSLKALDELNNNWAGVYENDSISTEIVDKKIEVVFSNTFSLVENDVEKEWIKSNRHGWMTIILSFLLSSFILISCILLVKNWRKNQEFKRFNSFANQLEEISNILKGKNDIHVSSDISNYSVNQKIAYCSTLLKSLQSYSAKLIDEKGFITKSFIGRVNELQASKLEALKTIKLLENEILSLKSQLNKTESSNEKQNLLEQVDELEQERTTLTSNCKLLENEVTNLQNSIAPLSDVFRAILTATRKKDSRILDEAIKGIMTDSFFNHIHEYVSLTQPQLLTEMRQTKSLSKNDINIVCMYLCHLPDTVIQIYANLTNTRSVNKLKKTIAQKLKSDPRASIEQLRKF